MAIRPLYLIQPDSNDWLKEHSIEFDWVSSEWNKEDMTENIAIFKENTEALEEKTKELFPELNIIDISPYSSSEIGVALDGINLELIVKDKKMKVESIYEGSKVFERSGPYQQLYMKPPRVARYDRRVYRRKDRKIITGFQFFGKYFFQTPQHYYYNWLYCNILHQHQSLVEQVTEYDGFTDSTKQPKRSKTSSAEALAIYMSMYHGGVIEDALESPERFFEYYNPLQTLVSVQ